MNIEGFRSTINALDVLPTNRYKVFIPEFAEEELKMCMDVTLPSESIQAFEYAMPGIGPVTKVPNRVIFDSLVLQFAILGDNRPYSTFREWKKKIYDDNYRFNDMDTYEREIVVVEYNRQGAAAGVHRFHRCYPSVVAPKTKNSAPSNTPELFTVTIAFETSKFDPVT